MQDAECFAMILRCKTQSLSVLAAQIADLVFPQQRSNRGSQKLTDQQAASHLWLMHLKARMQMKRLPHATGQCSKTGSQNA